jgi:hypothetical protein
VAYDMAGISGKANFQGSTSHVVFMSYSWTSETHKQWVLDLAKRLTSDGIHVILDVWDLKPGYDKNSFMEKIVTDPAVRKVLVICDKRYQVKADGRSGGVGAESQLISQEVYEKVDQDKFIPVVVEFDTDGIPCMPKYIASRMFFDMSKQSNFEKEYQRLVRDIYGKPEQSRPPLGEPPAYITEEAPSLPKAAAILKVAQSSALSARSATSLITAFFDQLLLDFEELRIRRAQDEPFDETLVKAIERMRPARDSLITFLGQLLQLQPDDEDVDLIHDYLERLAQLQYRPPDVYRYAETEWDQYRFICYELMLYFVAILIRNGKFSLAAKFINSTYFYESNLNRQQAESVALFNHYVKSLDEDRNARLQLRRVSVTADLIKSREEGSGIPFKELMAADLLLHYITLLNAPDSETSRRPNVWFPRLSVFEDYSADVPTLHKMLSRRHFNRVKVLFEVASPEELIDKINRAQQRMLQYYSGANSFHYHIPALAYAFRVEELASMP